MPKAIVLLSGGVDSAVALWLTKITHEVYALSFRYGDKNRNEMRAAVRLAEEAKVKEHIILEMGFLKDISEFKTEREVKEIGVPICYVPARNTIFFGIAAHFAERWGAEKIVTGHNRDDEFPDARRRYFDAINKALALGSMQGMKVEVNVPFLDMCKTQIVKMAIKLKVPLQTTWSCYEDGEAPCGICNGCLGLEKALKQAR